MTIFRKMNSSLRINNKTLHIITANMITTESISHITSRHKSSQFLFIPLRPQYFPGVGVLSRVLLA